MYRGGYTVREELSENPSPPSYHDVYLGFRVSLQPSIQDLNVKWNVLRSGVPAAYVAAYSKSSFVKLSPRNTFKGLTHISWENHYLHHTHSTCLKNLKQDIQP